MIGLQTETKEQLDCHIVKTSKKSTQKRTLKQTEFVKTMVHGCHNLWHSTVHGRMSN